MLFGEIVEPSTRALIDNDYEEYPEFVVPKLEWEGRFNIPSNLDTLIFIESNKIIKLFERLTLSQENQICSLKNENLKIYEMPNATYIISYTKSNLTTGQIVEILIEWIKKSKHVYAITSEPIATYQNSDISEKPESLIRMLPSVNSSGFSFKKLEPPNLVSGLGADVLSYCIHSGLKCILFVIYMDSSPLDSINTSIIIHLIKSLNLPLKAVNLNFNSSTSNLYV